MADGLLNKASIILTPTGYKAGTLYNVAPIDEPYEDFDFARTSTATRINSSGLVSNVATGVPRISYDSNGDNGHILLEPTSTNLITYSEDFNETGTDWSFGNGGTGSDPVETKENISSPDGSLGVSKIVFNNGGGTTSSDWSFTAHPYTSVADDFTTSIYLKGENGGEKIFVDCNNGNNNIVTLTTSWQRYEITRTHTLTTTRYIRIGLRGGTGSDVGETTVYAWGAQQEQLSYATSYIPTLTGSTVTRAAETATNAGSAELINSTEGVLYAEIAALNDDSDIKGISLGNLGTNVTTNGVAFYLFDNNLRARAYDSDYTLNGGVYFEATKSSISTNTFYKVAISWDSNGGKMYVDGALITPTRNLSGYGFAANYLNSLNFYRNSNDVFEGKCKALAVFNEALSDDELTQLTT